MERGLNRLFIHRFFTLAALDIKCSVILLLMSSHPHILLFSFQPLILNNFMLLHSEHKENNIFCSFRQRIKFVVCALFYSRILIQTTDKTRNDRSSQQ